MSISYVVQRDIVLLISPRLMTISVCFAVRLFDDRVLTGGGVRIFVVAAECEEVFIVSGRPEREVLGHWAEMDG